jgi:hypothetical protein
MSTIISITTHPLPHGSPQLAVKSNVALTKKHSWHNFHRSKNIDSQGKNGFITL